MNKKAFATDVLKHPLIEKLLEMNIVSPSVINRLIVEEILNEAAGSMRNRLKSLGLTAPHAAIVDASKHPKSPEGSTVTDDENLAIQISKTISGGLDSLKTVAEETINAGLTPKNMKAAVTTFEAMVQGMTQYIDNNEINDVEAGVLKQVTHYAQQLKQTLESPEFAKAGNTARYFKTELNYFLSYYEERSKTDPAAVVQAMNAGEDEEETGAETSPEVTTTEKVAGNEEAKTELSGESKSEADERIKTQAEADLESNPEREEEIKAAAEEIKADVDEMRGSDDEDDNVPRQDFADLFEETLADAFDFFSDKFISTRYMEEQRKAINDVVAALAAFREGMKKLKGSSLTSTDTITEAIDPTEEITPEEASELKQKQQEMIQALKNMAALIKAGDQEEDLFSKSRKDRIRREAEALQILLMDVNTLLTMETSPPPATPLQEVSRDEKIENIKKVYAAVSPIMLKVDEIIRNFKNPEERANVSVSTINDALDKIEDQLKTIQPYFGKRQTAFTKDKISYKNLAGLIKRFAKQLAQIITEMNAAMEDGKITSEGSQSLADKMKEISEDIEKYIGAPSRLKTKGATDVELEDEEEVGVVVPTIPIGSKSGLIKFVTKPSGLLDSTVLQRLSKFKPEEQKTLLKFIAYIIGYMAPKEAEKDIKENVSVVQTTFSKYMGYEFADMKGLTTLLATKDKETLDGVIELIATNRTRVAHLLKQVAVRMKKFKVWGSWKDRITLIRAMEFPIDSAEEPTEEPAEDAAEAAEEAESEEEEEEELLGTAGRHPKVKDNSVADYLFQKTKSESNPLYINTDKIDGENHMNRVLDYLADNKIKMKYTGPKLSTTENWGKVEEDDVITIEKKGSQLDDTTGYMKLGVGGGHSTQPISISWFLDADNFTVEEKEEEVDDSYLEDDYFDDTIEEEIQRKLETVVEAQIVNFLNKDKVKGGLDTISISGTEQQMKQKLQPGRWVKKDFEPKEQELYNTFRQTYVQEIEAIQEYISVQRTMRMTEKDKNILELCEQIIIWWEMFSKRPSVSAAEEFHKRYIQLIKLAGLQVGQGQNFVNIEDETMEEKLVNKLTSLVSEIFIRKQNG